MAAAIATTTATTRICQTMARVRGALHESPDLIDTDGVVGSGSDHRSGGTYITPPSFHSRLTPRSIPSGLMLRSTLSA